MAFAAVDVRNRVGRWQLGVAVASGAAASGATSVFVSYAAEKSPTMQLRGTVQTGRQAPAWSDADGPKWNLVAASAAASGIVACGAAIAERRARQPKVCIQANSQPTQGAGRSAAVPFLLAAPGLTNNPLDTTFPGDLGFDPLGFSSETDSPFYEVETYLSEVCENSGLPAFEKMRWYREAELMHGRVAMLATANIFTRELGEVVLPEQGLDIDGRLQFLEVMALFEAYRGYRLLVNTEALAGDLGVGMGPGGPIASGMSLEELAEKQCRELQNGRLAMLAVVGMVVQEVNNGYFIARNDELQTLKITVSNLPGTNPLNTVLGAVGMLVALTVSGVFRHQRQQQQGKVRLRNQFLEVMALFEAYRGYRLLVNTDALAGDLGVGIGPGGPIASGMSLEELAEKQCRELQNGRLAMIAVVGMAVQEVSKGYFIVRNDELQTLKDTVSTLPATNPLNAVLGAVGMLVALDGIRRL
eukprot:CAMPEP_0172781718 /NCGR_PEP_ID=MMETSP1074-20121228/203569_1 /TAXON_ID=2916 /ORGANISM="Ceratium fusus, Strain PA161109" /LENGTH=471 /DNA_ID=CAMNT_0013618695 /DNA_START=16 /DNA_END=1429 /DNA_ORIENTATION=+